MVGVKRSVLQELEVAVGALALGPEHAALIASCERLALAVDESDGFDDKLWREWRLLLSKLLDVGGGSGEGGDPLDKLVEDLRGAAVSHAEDEKRNRRA